MNIAPLDTDTKHRVPTSIPFSLLGGLVLAFLLGYACCALFSNLTSQQPVSFSTTSLIGFVLSVCLSGASIVLAVSAIMLGKFSEQAMITRSDESIRLQNEVFQKTTDALQRIESSTGVTEKRIEDIISGRVGDLSEKIASIASDKKESRGQLSPKDVEEMIKQSLLQGLTEERMIRRPRPSQEDMEKRLEAERKAREAEEQRETLYQERHMELLRAFSARKDLTALKMQHGNVGASGDALFDGIFAKDDGDRIAVTTFSSTHNAEAIRVFVERSLLEIKNGAVATSFIVLFKDNEAQKKACSDILSVADDKLAKRLPLIVCPPDRMGEIVSTLDISNKALQATSKASPSAAPEAPEG